MEMVLIFCEIFTFSGKITKTTLVDKCDIVLTHMSLSLNEVLENQTDDLARIT